ncbi:hypothetical protein B0H14DRAFT_1413433 [Mycena olivaceomarginata]|nr:hypothetical protein B0H14DRAFT_1413433 [Mycena olivaceomarginata]
MGYLEERCLLGAHGSLYNVPRRLFPSSSRRCHVAKLSSLELKLDFSLTGDRDVGKPKRPDSFLGDDLTSASAPPYYTNSFAETVYYSHQVPSLVDNAAYPLPPLTIPLLNGGPYLTARPLPAHLDVPWRQRESLARRAPGGTRGWVRKLAPPMAPREGQGQGEGWTSTLRVSMMGALHAITGVGAPQEEGDEGLTRAPSMQRERRGQGMGRQRQFAQEEGASRSSASTPYNGYLEPPW